MCESVENSPGSIALNKMQTLVFKIPSGAPKKRKKQVVLDEDSYVEEIGNIIQRDFFPDLEKLKAQNEYLEAMEQNDAVKLRELYMKYSGSRPPTQRMPSPATFETPANIHNSQASSTTTPTTHNLEEPQDKDKPKLSLDQYLNAHTSQDNESFEEILLESAKKHQQKYSYLYNEEDKSLEEQRRMLTLPSMEEQGALPVKQLNVDSWGYKNKNYIMYVPDGVALSHEEELERNKTRREVVHSNTRLVVNPFNDHQSKETINELAKTQAKVLDGKIGVDGKELLKDTPKIHGFSLVRSPSPRPGLLGSPLMTWGEIEGTPFRLDGGDTPLPRSQGPSFKMSEPPRREQIAIALAEKVGEKNRDQKKRALDAQRRQFQTPSPRRPNTSNIDRLATMSPAARKLASARLKLGVNSDLLASYSPSPSIKTPSTPRRLATPKRSCKKVVTEVSTDDLLRISLPKRQKAADFF